MSERAVEFARQAEYSGSNNASKSSTTRTWIEGVATKTPNLRTITYVTRRGKRQNAPLCMVEFVSARRIDLFAARLPNTAK